MFSRFFAFGVFKHVNPIGLTCLGGGATQELSKTLPSFNLGIVHQTITGILQKKKKERNRSRINGCWNAAGVQFTPAPWLQPTNQESQTSVNLKKIK
jgi:hypothetical protein